VYGSQWAIVMEHRELQGWLLKGAFENANGMLQIHKCASLNKSPLFMLGNQRRWIVRGDGTPPQLATPNRAINPLGAAVCERGLEALR